jgi:uncharacterized membrane protein YccC
MPSTFKPDARTLAFAAFAALMVAGYTAAMKGPWPVPGGPMPSWVYLLLSCVRVPGRRVAV